MKCEEIQQSLMGLIDGELSEEERKIVESHLSGCKTCQKEWLAFQKMETMMQTVKFVEPSENAWRGYWQSVYNRLERKFAWILMSIGSMILLGYLGYNILEEFFLSEKIPAIVKAGAATLGCGVIVMIVSIIRERLTLKKFDKYEDIEQ